MTEKRFIVIDVPYENGEPFLHKKMLDKTTKKEYDNTLKGIDDMCDLANKLHKEKEQLKSDNKSYVKRYGELFDEYTKLKEENKKLKQFKEKVFDWINGEIDSTKESHNVLLTGDEAEAIMEVLIRFKKELSE